MSYMFTISVENHKLREFFKYEPAIDSYSVYGDPIPVLKELARSTFAISQDFEIDQLRFYGCHSILEVTFSTKPAESNLDLLKALKHNKPIKRKPWATYMEPGESLHLSTYDALQTDWEVLDAQNGPTEAVDATGSIKAYKLTQIDLKAICEAYRGGVSLAHLLKDLEDTVV